MHRGTAIDVDRLTPATDRLATDRNVCVCLACLVAAPGRDHGCGANSHYLPREFAKQTVLAIVGLGERSPPAQGSVKVCCPPVRVHNACSVDSPSPKFIFNVVLSTENFMNPFCNVSYEGTLMSCDCLGPFGDLSMPFKQASSAHNSVS